MKQRLILPALVQFVRETQPSTSTTQRHQQLATGTIARTGRRPAFPDGRAPIVATTSCQNNRAAKRIPGFSEQFTDRNSQSGRSNCRRADGNIRSVLPSFPRCKQPASCRSRVVRSVLRHEAATAGTQRSVRPRRRLRLRPLFQ